MSEKRFFISIDGIEYDFNGVVDIEYLHQWFDFVLKKHFPQLSEATKENKTYEDGDISIVSLNEIGKSNIINRK